MQSLDASLLSNSEVSNLNNMDTNSNKNPEQNFLNRELRDVLEQAIKTLPENYAQVYIMREVEQMNVKETSEC